MLIDDGSHDPEHQRATLELLPHLRPGGVLVVEDINDFEKNHAFLDHLSAHFAPFFRGRGGPANELQAHVGFVAWSRGVAATRGEGGDG